MAGTAAPWTHDAVGHLNQSPLPPGVNFNSTPPGGPDPPVLVIILHSPILDDIFEISRPRPGTVGGGASGRPRPRQALKMGGVAAGRDPKKRPGVQDDPSCEEALLRSFGGGGESGRGLGCEVIGKLGEGSEGVVYVVQERGEGGKRFAVKAFKARNKQGVSTAAVREVKLLRELKHDNVVRLRSVHVAKPERRVFLSYECCSTDLQQLIRRHHANRDPIPEYTVKSALWQLLRALDYLHSSWVVHRDVKPENVLVDGETGACKIADFGCAKVFRNDPRALRQSTGAVVTLWYRAPELLLGCSDYSPAIDVWALGCVFAEMLRLRPLFHSEQRKGNRYARVLSVCVCAYFEEQKWLTE